MKNYLLVPRYIYWLTRGMNKLYSYPTLGFLGKHLDYSIRMDRGLVQLGSSDNCRDSKLEMSRVFNEKGQTRAQRLLGRMQ
jgi:hypothetical protein